MGVRAWVWVVLGVSLTVGVLTSWKVVAQQPPLSCEQSLKEMDFKRNAEMLQNRTLTDAFARELRVAVERAEKAEQALAQAKAAASEAAQAVSREIPGIGVKSQE